MNAVRFFWWVLGIGFFFFLMVLLVKLILSYHISTSSSHMASRTGMSYILSNVVTYPIFFGFYFGSIIFNYMSMLMIDQLRSHFYYKRRASVIRKFLEEDNDRYWGKRWLHWEVDSYSMGLTLKFDKKLIMPLLVWNWQKEEVKKYIRIEKVIRDYYNNEDDEFLPEF